MVTKANEKLICEGGTSDMIEKTLHMQLLLLQNSDTPVTCEGHSKLEGSAVRVHIGEARGPSLLAVVRLNVAIALVFRSMVQRSCLGSGLDDR
jgi:hypothetical protein